MKILFLTNIPAPYRVNFFNEVGKKIDLTVAFELKESKERKPEWHCYNFENFKGVFLSGIRISKEDAFCPAVVKLIRKGSFDYVIIGNFMSMTGMLATCYVRKKKFPYFLESDGGSPKEGDGIRERIKRFIIPGASGYFSTALSNDRYYEHYGADRERIIRYPFTSLFEKDILSTRVSIGQKQKLRHELKISEKNCIVSVGRFSYQKGYGKGYDTLFKVAEKLPKDIGIYIIGDNPTDEFVSWKKEKNLNQVHFVPFMDWKKLCQYYRAADLSILLTRGDAWGLVVNESLANGTPVIATDACIGAVEMIRDGYNGYIVPVDAVEETRKTILKLLSNANLENEVSENCLQTARKYTFEEMAKVHVDFFEHASRKIGQ